MHTTFYLLSFAMSEIQSLDSKIEEKKPLYLDKG